MHTTQISLLLSNIIRSSSEQIKRRRIIPQSWFKVLHRLPGPKQMVTLKEEKECHHCLLMSTRTFPEQLKHASMKKYREWRILELLLLLSGWGGSYEQKVSLSSAETELWQWNEVAGAAKERRTTKHYFQDFFSLISRKVQRGGRQRPLICLSNDSFFPRKWQVTSALVFFCVVKEISKSQSRTNVTAFNLHSIVPRRFILVRSIDMEIIKLSTEGDDEQLQKGGKSFDFLWKFKLFFCYNWI